tara:strand:- start:274 stop:621 length:348 start_codon:yes stop_codon:yes gene_type:complete
VTITAGSGITTVQTAVGLTVVPIVALLITGLIRTTIRTTKAITTGSLDTGDTTIIVVFIAVIAGLVVVIAGLKIGSSDPVTTRSIQTRVGASISINIVLVVTLLTFVDDTVTTVF